MSEIITEKKERSLSRRERERWRRRQAMLEAAQAVFAEKGYAQATLDEIAERAEFGKGTLYNYFEGGKEEMLFAIFDEVYDGMCAMVENFFAAEAARNRPARAVFRDFIAAFIAHFLEKEEVFMILIKEAHRIIFDNEEDNVARLHRQRERVVDHIIPHLEAAMESGQLRTLPPRAVAHMLMGNINGYLMFACSQTKECAASSSSDWRSSEEAADFLATILLDGLLTPPEASAPTP